MWEKRYNLLTPKRTKTNIRYYTNEDLRLLLNIATLVNNGHKISKASKYSKVEIVDYVTGINANVFTANHTISRLLSELIDLDELSINKILNSYIASQSIDKCVNEVMIPFMQRMGIMWQLNQTSPLEEHFMSNLFRQKIIGAIDRLPLKNSLPKCILFLPEDEWHELGMLYTYYLLRKKGYHVYYLGPSTPINSLNKSIDIVNPDFIVSAFSLSVNKDSAIEYLNAISCDCPIYLGGQLFTNNELILDKKFHILHNPKELVRALEK